MESYNSVETLKSLNKILMELSCEEQCKVARSVTSIGNTVATLISTNSCTKALSNVEHNWKKVPEPE